MYQLLPVNGVCYVVRQELPRSLKNVKQVSHEIYRVQAWNVFVPENKITRDPRLTSFKEQHPDFVYGVKVGDLLDVFLKNHTEEELQEQNNFKWLNESGFIVHENIHSGFIRAFIHNKDLSLGCEPIEESGSWATSIFTSPNQTFLEDIKEVEQRLQKEAIALEADFSEFVSAYIRYPDPDFSAFS